TVAGPLAELADRDRARHRPRSRPGRVHCADVALVPAGGDQRGLRPHRARQGAARGACRHAPRAAQRTPARDHDLGRAARLRARRLGGRGAGVRRARSRTLPRHGRDRARHHRRAKHRAALRCDLHRRERARRPELRVARSANSVRMTENVLGEAVRFTRRNRIAALGGIVGLAIILMALAAPWLAPRDPLKADFRRMNKPPDAQSFLGTDQVGRDTLSRIIYGARTSLFVAFSAVLLGTTVGSLWGVACGYLRGRFDLYSQRVMEVMQSFPDLMLAMAISMAIGTGLAAVIFAIAITRIPFGGRVIRSVALSVREMPYVEAGQASGASALRIMTQHVLPQCVAPYLVLATTHLGVAIVIEAALGFLGVGVPPPTPTWGNMLADSITGLVPPWWLAFFPGLAITITVLAFNLFGDGIRDTLDPRLSPAFLRLMTGGRKA